MKKVSKSVEYREIQYAKAIEKGKKVLRVKISELKEITWTQEIKDFSKSLIYKDILNKRFER